MMSRKFFFSLIVILGSVTFTINFYAVKVLSGLRAYINGESEYSKGEKDAVIYLGAYIETEDVAYWHSFQNSIKAPLGDNIARINLINNGPDSVARQGFITGKNNLNDLEDMIWLFKKFQHVTFMRDAINIWISADPLINHIAAAGNNVNAQNGKLSPEDKKAHITDVTYVSTELSKKESYFSYRLSGVARKTKSYLFLTNVFCCTVLLGTIILYVISIFKKLKDSQETLRKSVDIIGFQNQRLLNFAYTVCHNIRSYVARVTSVITLFESADSADEKEELLQIMKKNSVDFTETITHLEEIVKAQANTGLQHMAIDVRSYVEKCLGIIEVDVATSMAVIRNNVPPETYITYNPAYLESILLNLLINALKYRSPGRRPTVTIEVTNLDTDPTLHVKDNGIGIDLHKYGSKLFGMYNTFHNNADARGIGLFIVKYQVESLGGHIDVTSEPGVGTEFSVHFFTHIKKRK